MKKFPDPIPPAAKRCMCRGGSAHVETCMCSAAERAVRAFAYCRPADVMTPEQRRWCLDEIAAVEGFRREDHDADDDMDLARCVLDAWTEYCRDKGLID